LPRVAPADLERWLTSYLRTELAALALAADVGNKEPDTLTATSPPLVVVRADLGAKRSAVSFDASVGYSVLAGTRKHDAPANDLVRIVYGIVTDDAMLVAPGSPFASIDAERITGPYAVQEPQDKARRYFTVPYVTVGTW